MGLEEDGPNFRTGGSGGLGSRRVPGHSVSGTTLGKTAGGVSAANGTCRGNLLRRDADGYHHVLRARGTTCSS